MSALKLALCLPLFFLIFIFSSTSAFAELTYPGQTESVPIKPDNWKAEQQNIYDVDNKFCGFVVALSGLCPYTELTPARAVTENGQIKLGLYKNLPQGGAIMGMGSLVAVLYSNPPTSSVYYLANLGENLGIAPKNAYAQVAGSGGGVLEPVLKLWQISRNIAYLIFIAIFLAVGVMIMFRQKISQQAVLTVEQALPSLVIGLILITFSYFIAAFLVDLAFVGIQLVVQIFASASTNVFGNPDQLRDLARNGNVVGLFLQLGIRPDLWANTYTGTLSQLFSSFNVGAVAIPGVVGAVAGALTIGLPLLLGGILGATATFIIPILLIFVLLVALFIQLVRLAFSLLNAYIQILIFTIAGPFYILIGSIPGKGAVIESWWKGILANALIFPAVFAGFLFAGVVLGPDTNFDTTLPLFGGVNSNFIKLLIGYGILLGTPAIPETIRSAFKVQGLPAIGQQAQGGFTAGLTAGTALGRPALRGGATAIQESWKSASDGSMRKRVATGLGRVLR